MLALANSPRPPSNAKRPLQWLLLGGVLAATLVTGQSPGTPEVNLSPEPLYMNGAKTKANLTLALSVERPTVGQAHRGGTDNMMVRYDHSQTYLGYFDPGKCYTYNTGNPDSFDEHSDADTVTRRCSGGKFLGNFMNWATTSAIDIFRMGLTGGNRVVDVANRTLLERAWLPDDFYRGKELFSPRYVSKQEALGLVEQSLYTDIPPGTGGPLPAETDPTRWKPSWGGMWIYNCKNRVYFAKAEDRTYPGWNVFPTNQPAWQYQELEPGDCNRPFQENFKGNGSHDKMIGPTSNSAWFDVRVRVCDSSSANRRLMQYNPNTKKWSGLCYQYGSNNYKPVGQLQMHAESVRVATFGYTMDHDRARYGGVLRAPMKYLGPKNYDANFNLLGTVNPNREWNDSDGRLIVNPHPTEDQGFGISGTINYINKFGTLGPQAQWGQYKSRDPVGELYYEALRYVQSLPPTASATIGLTAAQKDNFPVYTQAEWVNPFQNFVDSTGTAPSCLRNSIVAVADIYTHSDRSIPGNTIVPASPANNGEWARPTTDSNPPFDVMHWTRVVGSFESKTTATATVTYTDSQGRTQIAGNLPGFTPLDPRRPFYDPWLPQGPSASPTLENAATEETGSTGGSYYMAGMAYWANTQKFHKDFPKARARTYVIDVNERQDSTAYPDYRRTRHLHLAAKYGGFSDSATGNTGNPYALGSNALWQDINGDAQNYFLASDAPKFLDSIAEVFAKVVDETGSIAGGAISTQRITSAAAGAVFQARFNPNANFWSGRVLKHTISLATNTLVLSSTPTWEAGQVLTTATRSDNGASRKIVIGPPAGQQGAAPSDFSWGALHANHQAALSSNPANVTDTLGPLRVNYLRGDQTNEIAANNPVGYFRPRDIVLGDIVNSGLIYMGKPDSTQLGSTDSNNAQAVSHRAFLASNAGRPPVVFVNANDGMLHAFDDQTGAETFAYIPGFLSGKLNLLPERDYMHVSLNDATPAVADVYLPSKGWKTALVSGVGGGGQGVFALDVTTPAAFTTTSVLWEFTDRDHAAMGNVIGTPQILKFRQQNANASGTHTYKTLAVVASGVNNYKNDTASGGLQYSGGNPSLFFLDMDHIPTTTSRWVEGQNFWRIELPQSQQGMAKGLVGFNSVTDPQTNTVNTLYAGDLQGNLWKLDFSSLGFNSGNLSNNASQNFQNFNPINGNAPLFIATTTNGTLQPLTGMPEIVHSYFGKKLVVFGSGKFLESTDTTVPLVVNSSVYAVLDDPAVKAPTSTSPDQAPVLGRGALQAGTMNAVTGTVTMAPFTLGAPPATTPINIKSGWYFDLDPVIGERQVSDITAVNNRLVLATLYPTRGSCGEGGGRIYSLDALTGTGYSVESTVGVLAAPLVLNMGTPTVTVPSGTTGRRMAQDKFGVISQGAKGLQTTTMVDTFNYPAGRMSWRLINNHDANPTP